MKRGKGITINLSNKVAYTLIAIFVFAVIGGVVFAYNSNPANPAVFGHSADEIEGLDGIVGGGSLICTLKNSTEQNAKICCEEGEYPLQHGMVNADTGGSISDDYNVGIVDNNRCLQFHATGGISYRKQVLCCK
jgi:hypothetical protein